jgi:thioredoxin reductase
MDNRHFDVIIVGGSYAGLSAAMALGRSLRNVLVIDSGTPCNRQTPYSHNVITHDGEPPAVIAARAKEQVLRYDTVKFLEGRATTATQQSGGFDIHTEAGERFTAAKLLFTTGMTDILPPIPGLAECWGISVIHCPYCHGYEVRGQKTGVLANGEMGLEVAKLIRNWTSDLTLYTNGSSTLTAEQTQKLRQHGIAIVETEIERVDHDAGRLTALLDREGNRHQIAALYARSVLQQQCSIPQELGCEITEAGFIQIDDFHKTTVPGVYAAGDNTTMFRSVSVAIAAGTKAGALLNKELIDETF